MNGRWWILALLVFFIPLSSFAAEDKKDIPFLMWTPMRFGYVNADDPNISLIGIDPEQEKYLRVELWDITNRNCPVLITSNLQKITPWAISEDEMLDMLINKNSREKESLHTKIYANKTYLLLPYYKGVVISRLFPWIFYTFVEPNERSEQKIKPTEPANESKKEPEKELEQRKNINSTE
ncbi:hypothetical protein A3F08_00700 [Candidatus Berkelbacteria bacterium RIFCSPHIGHO2_12_FULL_36_9]|uniref:Uncharacterized protein n=1 Tax=Candidatus Berkelbacteria bacterium RIFCSPHIGHO2_12_FULL_36_9 TaxID=1797469 RepID=A0A1F5EIJ7_9BACT|nr:MAG: hypothetical protein A3F08_00700 [Candidatus Berkelbacteria bacterium RIFCSPHIGHO2_12_FULL_36_9]